MAKYVVGFILLILGICAALFHFYPEGAANYDLVSAFHANASTELIGIAITVLIIDALNERRQNKHLKAQLIREMHSPDNGFATRAAEELRAHRWLFDGSLNKANLNGANISGANLSDAVMRGAILTDAILQKTNLRGAKLDEANLSGANLEGASLRGARLYGATLAGANLKFAVLIKADLDLANLKGAVYNANTQWSDNFDPQRLGAVLEK